ncbi:hypothetical protein [Methanomassiliicoccus luminyensis]|uniref:hypothetical protein n=1 Tax=Methanomassiliicoccus luminyensis TaxID=1080712 RepID=UPI000371F77D|nr:hypothetical protein [Methanomassiliicoccus luminyensis]
MRARTISAMVLLAMLALCIAAPSASAVSTDLQRVSAPGVDLWISDYAQVQYSEIVLLINYLDTPVVLQLREAASGENVTTYTLAPGSSEVYELVYPNLGQYTVVVGDLSAALIELPRERPATYLPPPRDSGWSWTRPDSSEPKIYTAADVAEMIADTISRITMEVWILTFITAIGGFAAGAAVKRSTLFLVPADVISIFIYAFVATDLLFDWTGLGIGLYYVPFIAGYLIGFFVAHVTYVMVQQDDLGNKTSTKRPVVLYSPNEEIGYCIQQQSNKALIKRWMGYHHRLGTDAGLAPDWADSTKYPYFPKFRRMVIMVEESVTEYEDKPFMKWFTVRTYTTYWQLSNASKFPKGMWKKSSAAIIWARDLINRLYGDLITERQKGQMVATQVAAEMHTYTIGRSTHRAIFDQFTGAVPPLNIPETQENVMRPVTRATAAPQRMPEDVEPEQTEREDKDELEEESEPTMEKKNRRKN